MIGPRLSSPAARDAHPDPAIDSGSNSAVSLLAYGPTLSLAGPSEVELSSDPAQVGPETAYVRPDGVPVVLPCLPAVLSGWASRKSNVVRMNSSSGARSPISFARAAAPS